MARSKSSISTTLAPFQRQAYQSWYLDGYTLAEFTKLMDVLFEQMGKITFERRSTSERQWRTCKTVWDNVWNIKGGGIPQEARLELENLHIWFCKSPRGATIWKPLGLDSLTLATLLPGLTMASETLHLVGQPRNLNQCWRNTSDDDCCVMEHKPKPLYLSSVPSETNQHYPEANASDTHGPYAHGTTLVSYSQPTETNVSMEGVSRKYTPYSQASDSSCVLTGQTASETASSIDDVGPYCTNSCHRGTICTPNGPAKNYTEWPDVSQGCQCSSTGNNLGFDLCSKDTPQLDWLADIGF